jgi:hypothetical protein
MGAAALTLPGAGAVAVTLPGAGAFALTPPGAGAGADELAVTVPTALLIVLPRPDVGLSPKALFTDPATFPPVPCTEVTAFERVGVNCCSDLVCLEVNRAGSAFSCSNPCTDVPPEMRANAVPAMMHAYETIRLVLKD